MKTAETTAGAPLAAIAACVTFAFSGCFYPPLSAKPVAAQNRVRLAIPYDLAWDAVNEVIRENNYVVRAQDPNHGIIEAQATNFTGQEADCGEFRSLGGRYTVEPTQASSAEYTFHLKADGREAAIVDVEATFVAPLSVPFHPPTSIECISREVNEARLLTQIRQAAAVIHRPAYVSPIH